MVQPANQIGRLAYETRLHGQLFRQSEPKAKGFCGQDSREEAQKTQKLKANDRALARATGLDLVLIQKPGNQESI